MNNTFLALSADDRQLALDDAALRLGTDPVILEKDFWVSWLLGLLFTLPDIAPHLVFNNAGVGAGGFGVTDRFSEDIDLCLVPEFVGADAVGFDELTSRVKRDAAVLEMQRLCAEKAKAVVLPLLDQAIAEHLGASPAGAWLRYELDADSKSPIIYFGYPSAAARRIRLPGARGEAGAGHVTDQQPTEVHPVRPLLADAFPALFDDWACSVRALALQRTFGKRPPSCMPSFTGRPNHQRPTGTRALFRHGQALAASTGRRILGRYHAMRTGGELEEPRVRPWLGAL